ncbi:protein YqbG [Heyndrickxia sp. NPDC080065]|uniref:protein YqbG n=1 Tax=Heyndrickxia sp. NPDC080065 TaxID=3390568 RepID=UPI003D0418CC
MLIAPSDLKDYTDFETVKERDSKKLEKDILEAEVEVESIVGHDFSDEEYKPLPDKAKLAMLKMAQYFALINSDESIIKGYKSEKISDYSYTLADGNSLRKPDVYTLLKDFIANPENKGFRLRMRSI